MQIHGIELDLHFAGDGALDVFLFQWYTPVPIDGSAFRKILPESSTHKRRVVEQFVAWFGNNCSEPGDRPVFILFPELSLPATLIPLLQEFVQSCLRPIVVIAGVEHLTWDEYRGILATLGNPPHTETQPQGEESQINSAVVLIRQSNGVCRSFVQSKLHPSYFEAAGLHVGQHALFFHSQNPAHGMRLNFCVQICSDFASPNFVASFRQQLLQQLPGIEPDFLFLLQYQDNLNAAQLRGAVMQFFSRQLGVTPTDRACVVIVNNALERHWEATDAQSCRLCLPRGTWTHTMTAQAWRTFWARVDNDYNHEAVIGRESGPGIYRLAYKPHYLVDNRRGADQATPFPNSCAYFCEIGATGLLPIDNAQFSQIHPEAHWLRCMWSAGRQVFTDDMLANSGIADGHERQVFQEQVLACCAGAYTNGVKEWCDYLMQRPENARRMINRYCCCCRETGSPDKTTEPFQWRSSIGLGVQRFMQCYSLMSTACAGGADRLEPNCSGSIHAVAGTTLSLSFVWGDGKHSPERVVQLWRDDAGMAAVAGRVLLIIVDPLNPCPQDELPAKLKAAFLRVDKADDVCIAGSHLAPRGDVVRTELRVSVTYSAPFFRGVYDARDQGTLREGIATALRSAMEEGVVLQ